MIRRRLPGFVRWLWPILATAGTIYAVWAVFMDHKFTEREDGWLALSIGLSYLVATIFLVANIRRWSFRSIGQVVTYLADSGLYVGAGLVKLGRWHPRTEGELTLIRAAFVVGCTFLVLGLVWWAVQRRREPSVPVPTVTPRRRAGDWRTR